MGAAAYNRGSRLASRQIDAIRQTRSERCGGKFFNGPAKRFARCSRCASIDYEANEGDTCLRIVDVTREAST